MYSDNGFTFCSAVEQLSTLLGSTEFHNSLRKRNTNWVKSHLTPIVKAKIAKAWLNSFKNAFNRILDNPRRKPSLIELQTFTFDAVRIVNDRPLTTLSDKSNDLASLAPSSFLGQRLAPNTPISAFHNRGDLRRDFMCNAKLAHRFWLCWVKGYFPTLQGRSEWRVTRKKTFFLVSWF